MQTLTERVFKLSPPGGFFNETVISGLFPDATKGATRLLVHRACRAGEVIRLKPGTFVLAPPYRKTEPHPFVLAAILHSPSHVSGESALAYHGLIPEAVYQVVSVTVRRSRLFKTPLGTFHFLRVPMRNPHAGVESVEVARRTWAFVASPLRAIADMVYVTPDISWERDAERFLTESLRIEEDDLRDISFAAFDEILESSGSHRVKTYLKGLRGFLC